MKQYSLTPSTEQQVEDVAAVLRSRFEAGGGRVSVGMDGRSFWVFGPSDSLIPDATVDVKRDRLDVSLINERAGFAGSLGGWLVEFGVDAPPAPPSLPPGL